jgi:hypothetical protein
MLAIIKIDFEVIRYKKAYIEPFYVFSLLLFGSSSLPIPLKIILFSALDTLVA